MELIEKYFPWLTSLQIGRFAALHDLYEYWNDRINVVSRKDIENLYLRHVLHSLAIAKVCAFRDGARVLDAGTGGGFPGIPLAIMFPEVSFTLADSIAKKISVVKAVSGELRLENVSAVNSRAECVGGRFDYVTGRAVADMSVFAGWVWDKIDAGCMGSLPAGILCLKGGELDEEMRRTGREYSVYDISSFFEEDFFVSKKVVYIPRFPASACR